MGTVTLEITSPTHQSTILGAAADNVQLAGSVDHPAPESLFYKWYSSLYNPEGIETADHAPKAALNWPNHGLAALDIPKNLSVGSHIITLTAKDVEGDSLADMQAVQEAGMAGGPVVEGSDNPCVIHIFKARIVTSESTPLNELSLSSESNVLQAEAPLKWGKKSEAGNYVRDQDYHAINRIRYRWRFEPAGGGTPIGGLPSLDATDEALAAFQEDLEFDFVNDPLDDHSVPVVRYTGDLPDGLTTGTYNLVLRVEYTQAPHDGDEDSVEVEIIG